MAPKFAKVLVSGKLPWLDLSKAYIDIWLEQFGRDQVADYWYMIGSAYGAVDGSARSLDLTKLTGVDIGNTTDPMIYRIAFRNGYRNFQTIQSRISRDSRGAAALSHIQARI